VWGIHRNCVFQHEELSAGAKEPISHGVFTNRKGRMEERDVIDYF
jgi:hypothetical protein